MTFTQLNRYDIDGGSVTSIDLIDFNPKTGEVDYREYAVDDRVDHATMFMNNPDQWDIIGIAEDHSDDPGKVWVIYESPTQSEWCTVPVDSDPGAKENPTIQAQSDANAVVDESEGALDRNLIDTDDATVRTDLVVEDVDLHPDERDAVERVVQEMVDGGEAYVLPNDAVREKRELFESVVDVCHELDAGAE